MCAGWNGQCAPTGQALSRHRSNLSPIWHQPKALKDDQHCTIHKKVVHEREMDMMQSMRTALTVTAMSSGTDSCCMIVCAGGAVAGPMAAGALVGIGAAALTGGAVLDAVNFPRSPARVSARQVMPPLE